MASRSAPPSSPVRRRRTAEEARTSILDAAERRLVESGPEGIRLQEVAADVGVSHPTVLHHFGNREALVEAVVERALDALHRDLIAAMQGASEDADEVTKLLESVSSVLAGRGHGRTFLWLALSGYSARDHLHVQAVAEVVHQIRKQKRKEKGKRPPRFDDTYFTILLPALALLALSVAEAPKGMTEDDPLGAKAFRRWLARLIHEHLENG